MEDRRTFMALATALFPASMITLSAQAQTPAGAPSPAAAPPRELARHPLTGPLAAFEALLIELRPGPGQGREHRHNGPVLGYVLEGRVRFGVNHEPERIFGAGETFYEETGALHSSWGSVDTTPARVIVFMVVPKGTDIRADVTPADITR